MVLVLGTIWAMRRSPEPVEAAPRTPLAKLVRTDQAVWRALEPQPRPGDGFHDEPMKLVRGRAELELAAGTRIVLEAPAEFTFTGPNSIDLHRGKLAATVPPQATGFTITTMTARIVDRGTQVGVFASKGGNFQIATIEGKVEVIPHDGTPPMLLEAGQSAMLTNTGLARTEYNPSIYTFTLEGAE